MPGFTGQTTKAVTFGQHILEMTHFGEVKNG